MRFRMAMNCDHVFRALTWYNSMFLNNDMNTCPKLVICDIHGKPLYWSRGLTTTFLYKS